jgi:hypothetical protein
MSAPASLAHNLQHYAETVADILDDVIGSRCDSDESRDCFECAIVSLRFLRQDLQKKADEILHAAKPLAESEGANG